MSNPTDPSTPLRDQATGPAEARRRYEAPVIVEDLPLEIYSLSCNKADNNCTFVGAGVIQS